METSSYRVERLAEFETEGEAFRAAMEEAPEASLTYLRDGDDYALGGLLLHVTAGLETALSVLRAIQGGAGVVQLRDHVPAGDQTGARARRGLEPAERPGALAAMTERHRDVAAHVRSLTDADWTRSAEVRFAAAEPLSVSPADFVGRLAAHYREHAGQATGLLAQWRARG